VLLPRRLDVNVQAEQAKSAEAPFANVDGGSEATTACFSRLLLLSLALQRRAEGISQLLSISHLLRALIDGAQIHADFRR